MKRWLSIFILSSFICISICTTISYLVDPIAIYKDSDFVCNDFSQNVRYSKISYLDKNFQKYNSYIIGGSKAGALSPATANKYIKDASFYNLWMPEGDFYDYEKTIYYLIDNYKVNNILLQISIYESEHFGESDIPAKRLHPNVTGEYKPLFFAKYLFVNLSQSISVFQDRLRGIQSTKNLYSKEDGSIIYYNPNYQVSIDEFLNTHKTYNKVFTRKEYYTEFMLQNTASLKNIKDYCNKHKVNLFVSTAPTYSSDIAAFDVEGLNFFWREISKVVDFWDFAGYNSLSTDPRNFYNRDHFRKEIGDLVLARIFNDKNVQVPADFGGLRTKNNISKYLKKQNSNFYPTPSQSRPPLLQSR